MSKYVPNLTYSHLDALKDSNEALHFDETNAEAYLRKGVALYNQNFKEQALEVFARALEYDGKLTAFAIETKTFIFFEFL